MRQVLQNLNVLANYTRVLKSWSFNYFEEYMLKMTGKKLFGLIVSLSKPANVHDQLYSLNCLFVLSPFISTAPSSTHISRNEIASNLVPILKQFSWQLKNEVKAVLTALE